MLYKEQIGHAFVLADLKDHSVKIIDVSVLQNKAHNFALKKILNFSEFEISEGKLTIYSMDTEESYVFVSNETIDYFVWELREIIRR